MGAMKCYLLNLICIGKTNEEQDAIEWAIYSGWVKLAYKKDDDTKLIRRELPKLIEAFRRVACQHEYVESLNTNSLASL